MLVSDYMTPDPFLVATSEPVPHIAELIRRRGIHQVPVVDRRGRLVGIVTERDIRSAAGSDPEREAGLLAEDVMTVGVISVAPGDELRFAVNILCERRFGALPVIIGEKVVGILSSRDLLRRLMEILEKGEEDGSQPVSDRDAAGIPGLQ